MGATFGRKLKMTIFGESHGKGIGLVIDGLPPGTPIDEEFIRSEMQRRAPGRNGLSTQRQETDAFIIESGLFEGKATGTPMCVLIPNSDQHSKDYSILKSKMRPGHADYAGRVKYRGFNDYRGGGHFSGRITAPLVFMGAVSKLVLQAKGINIGAHIMSIGGVVDEPFEPLGVDKGVFEELRQQTLPTLDKDAAETMEQMIMAAKAAKDSVGGTIECMVTGLEAGVGDPFFDSLESSLAHALFSVPAVKGLSFGKGFELAYMQGSQANDQMTYRDDRVVALTNNNGGITGGISNGMPVLFTVAIKPTPSISQPQHTVDVEQGVDTILEISGRHDPCIVQRAVPVIEGVAAWVVLDMLLSS